MYTILCFFGDVFGSVFLYKCAYRLNPKRFTTELALSAYDYTVVLREEAMR